MLKMTRSEVLFFEVVQVVIGVDATVLQAASEFRYPWRLGRTGSGRGQVRSEVFGNHLRKRLADTGRVLFGISDQSVIHPKCEFRLHGVWLIFMDNETVRQYRPCVKTAISASLGRRRSGSGSPRPYRFLPVSALSYSS